MNEAKRDTTSAVIDNLLRLIVGGSFLASGFVAPNALIAFDKPVKKYFFLLDSRARERELRRIVRQMKYRGLIKGSYDHGLQITSEGHKRLQKAEFNELKIDSQKEWDQHWRLVLFDIPEQYKQGRNALSFKLRQIGFWQLQKSVWVHPFPCREVIEKISAYYKIDRYVTYIETNYIDNQEGLIARFKPVLPINHKERHKIVR
jgi:DNA-binding transcriptional regulator PaaX